MPFISLINQAASCSQISKPSPSIWSRLKLTASASFLDFYFTISAPDSNSTDFSCACLAISDIRYD